jgi:hypothetical protein
MNKLVPYEEETKSFAGKFHANDNFSKMVKLAIVCGIIIMFQL